MPMPSEPQLQDINSQITSIINRLSRPGGDNQENRNEKDRLLSLRDQLINKVNDEKTMADYEKNFSDYSGGAIDQFKRQIAPQRSKLIDEEAALGRLDSPVARTSLNEFDTRAQNTMSDLIAKLAGEKATGELGYSKFSQNLGLERQSLAEQMKQFQDKLDLEGYLGRRKLDISEPEPIWHKLVPETKLGFGFSLPGKG